ncbi:MAG: hypothetical protein CTY38_00970 [Methylotenera sp.]|uniref:helix-turn-helix transcriptional regulator n=1 Tax=Methylotenera sp. TaxID=2051956 RepID=UPI000D4416CB|nr:helix-turn-helix transcriptional regulator [Methylotenera sp.]PPC84650.1 MAG: hypothetical protein CTY38_00970 [Methylotenera sp.]
MTDINTFIAAGKQIRAMRLLANLTQAELAARLEVSRLTIIEMEAGGNVGLHIFLKALDSLGGKIVLPIEAGEPMIKIRATKKINAANYPQLNLVMWDRSVKAIQESDAFYLYEKNKRFLDVGKMDTKELALLTRLTKKYGKGLML